MVVRPSTPFPQVNVSNHIYQMEIQILIMLVSIRLRQLPSFRNEWRSVFLLFLNWPSDTRTRLLNSTSALLANCLHSVPSSRSVPYVLKCLETISLRNWRWKDGIMPYHSLAHHFSGWYLYFCENFKETVGTSDFRRHISSSWFICFLKFLFHLFLKILVFSATFQSFVTKNVIRMLRMFNLL